MHFSKYTHLTMPQNIVGPEFWFMARLGSMGPPNGQKQKFFVWGRRSFKFSGFTIICPRTVNDFFVRGPVSVLKGPEVLKYRIFCLIFYGRRSFKFSGFTIICHRKTLEQIFWVRGPFECTRAPSPMVKITKLYRNHTLLIKEVALIWSPIALVMQCHQVNLKIIIGAQIWG